MAWIVVKKNGKKKATPYLYTDAGVEGLDSDRKNTYTLYNIVTAKQITVGKNRARTRLAEVDDTAVRELVLYIDNDSELYRRRAQPIMTNLAKKMVKGTYDSAKAVQLWKYLVDDGAKKYKKEFGSDSPIFSVADRKAAAVELAKAFEAEAKANPAYIEKLAGKKTSEVKRGRKRSARKR